MPPVVYRRQRDLLEFISQYMQKKGYAPTLGEICDGIGLRSPATVHEHIENLIKKGILRKTEGARRGLEIVDQKAMGWVPTGVEVPILGKIAAGHPIEAINDPTQTITIPEDMVGTKRTYVLQVKGDSMIEAAILDGDYVLIESTETAHNGEIIVALINDNFATLKRYYKEADHIRLEPANSAMNPIIVRGDIQIQGRVTGVIRKYS
jgi:repressor LexA